jgi:penicillin-binding protein 2
MKSRPEQRISLFIFFTALALTVLASRLYYLQVIKGDYYLQRSESNFLQERVIKHNRGKILDRHGRVLVDNRLSYDLYVTFALLPDSLKYLRMLGGALKIPRKDLLEINNELVLRAQASYDEDLLFLSQLEAGQCREISALARTKMIPGVNITIHGSRCDVAIDSTEFPSLHQASDRLQKLLNLNSLEFFAYWQKAQKKTQGLARFKPSLLMSDIGFDAYARIENAISLGLLAGITVVPSKRRRYIYDDFATHVIGYLNQVSLEELKDKEAGYRSGDYIGRRGVEAAFENSLRGQDGIEQLVVDAKGRRFSAQWEDGLLGVNRMTEPKAGLNLKLSIDYELQKKAQELFSELSGSIIVMDVNSGFIRTMASFPSFNPNIIVGGDNAKFVSELLKDENRPFRNKAMQDHYSPGSTFKPFTAISGLTKQLVAPSSSYNCTGTYKIHNTSWRCFKREGHGPISMGDSLRVSCDGYYYSLGHRLGLDDLAQTAATLGFGSLTGISLPGETAGILPTRAYYNQRFGYVAPGFVVNMAIGQGDLSVTPLQLAVAYSAIANGGIIYQPQLVEQILDEKGQPRQIFEKKVKTVIADSSYNFAEILRGLSYVTEPGGSAHGMRYKPEFADIANWMKNNEIHIVGKTGTAQRKKLPKNIKHLMDITKVLYKERDDSWFVMFWPEKKPELVIIVMTEHGGFGGATSAPVAVRLMKYWHEKNAPVAAKIDKIDKIEEQ